MSLPTAPAHCPRPWPAAWRTALGLAKGRGPRRSRTAGSARLSSGDVRVAVRLCIRPVLAVLLVDDGDGLHARLVVARTGGRVADFAVIVMAQLERGSSACCDKQHRTGQQGRLGEAPLLLGRVGVDLVRGRD